MTGHEGGELDGETFVAREQARQAAVPDLAPERPRRNRPAIVAVAVAFVLLLGVGVFALTHGSGGDDTSADRAAASPAPNPSASPAAAAPPTSVSLPSGATTRKPSGVAKAETSPPIAPARAFPDRKVTLPSGSVYELVDVQPISDCRAMMSEQMANIVDQGRGCAGMAVGLYVDAARARQVTVSVVSMNRSEDAGMMFSLSSMDPVTFQVAAMDPPAGSGVPAPPATAPGEFARVMSVRSVVFTAAMYTDGHDEQPEGSPLAADASGLLAHVSATVDAYEEAAAR